MNKYSLFLVAINIGIAIGCSSVWEQCGGQYWVGSTCCLNGSKCVFSNPWYSQCLPAPPAPPAPSPTPAPPAPSTPPTSLLTYCPAIFDLTTAYYSDYNNQPKIYDQGWSITNGGGVATKSAFNLLGGSVEYDVDFRRTLVGVNVNIYTISPTIPSSGFTKINYCDAQKSGSEWCMELDWIESNGNCGGATTLHTVAGTGNQDCTAWGCSATYQYNGKSNFHMKITYDINRKMFVYRDGLLVSNYSPAPSTNAWNTIATIMKSKGVVVYSSQWVGWVPLQDKCGTGGNLANSQYSISNLRIVGTIVQGPVPHLC